MQAYIEILDLLQEYLDDYQKMVQEKKINRYNAPLFLQYRSEIQDLIDYFEQNKEIIPFSIYQDFQKLISSLIMADEELTHLIPEIKRFVNLSHYQTKYPKEHWWWYS
ncbi:MAG: hypothetical protein ABDH21_03080 [bacterium]